MKCFETVVVQNTDEWTGVCSSVVKVLAVNECCNDSSFSRLDFSKYTCLKTLVIGTKCFRNVKEVILNGLSYLESVTILGASFMDLDMKDIVRDPNNRFYLTNCPRITKLEIGMVSFACYSVCEIHNVPKLETLEIGELDNYSFNFYEADFHLSGMDVALPSW